MSLKNQGYVIECKRYNITRIITSIIQKKGGTALVAGTAVFTDFVIALVVPEKILNIITTRPFSNKWEVDYWETKGNQHDC